MKYLFSAAKLSIIALLLSGCLSEDLRGDLKGVITDAGTQEPLGGVTIECRSMKNNRILSGITDADGNYSVTDLTYGLNEVTITLDGYYTRLQIADIEKDRAIQRDLELVRILDTRGLNAAIIVIDQEGISLEGASVVLYEHTKDEFGGLGYADTILGNSITDTNGKAVFLNALEIAEQEMKFLRIDVALPGYRSRSMEGMTSYLNPNFELTIELTTLD